MPLFSSVAHSGRGAHTSAPNTMAPWPSPPVTPTQKPRTAKTPLSRPESRVCPPPPPRPGRAKCALGVSQGTAWHLPESLGEFAKKAISILPSCQLLSLTLRSKVWSCPSRSLHLALPHSYGFRSTAGRALPWVANNASVWPGVKPWSQGRKRPSRACQSPRPDG